MNIIIPSKTVAWMRNIIAVFISLALIWTSTPTKGYDLLLFLFCVPPACFLIVMVATQREIFAGILFAVGYISVNIVRKKLEHQDDDWLDFLVVSLYYSLFSLIGTTPVYLWRRWRRRHG